MGLEGEDYICGEDAGGGGGGDLGEENGFHYYFCGREGREIRSGFAEIMGYETPESDIVYYFLLAEEDSLTG